MKNKLYYPQKGDEPCTNGSVRALFCSRQTMTAGSGAPLPLKCGGITGPSYGRPLPLEASADRSCRTRAAAPWPPAAPSCPGARVPVVSASRVHCQPVCAPPLAATQGQKGRCRRSGFASASASVLGRLGADEAGDDSRGAAAVATGLPPTTGIGSGLGRLCWEAASSRVTNSRAAAGTGVAAAVLPRRAGESPPAIDSPRPAPQTGSTSTPAPPTATRGSLPGALGAAPPEAAAGVATVAAPGSLASLGRRNAASGAGAAGVAGGACGAGPGSKHGKAEVPALAPHIPHDSAGRPAASAPDQPQAASTHAAASGSSTCTKPKGMALQMSASLPKASQVHWPGPARQAAGGGTRHGWRGWLQGPPQRP